MSSDHEELAPTADALELPEEAGGFVAVPRDQYWQHKQRMAEEQGHLEAVRRIDEQMKVLGMEKQGHLTRAAQLRKELLEAATRFRLDPKKIYRMDDTQAAFVPVKE